MWIVLGGMLQHRGRGRPRKTSVYRRAFELVANSLCNTLREAGFQRACIPPKNWWGARFHRVRKDMKKWIAVAALVLPLALAGCSHPQPVAVYAPPPPPVADAGQQGYHDGFEAARRDVAEGRPPHVERHPRFRNPPVPPQLVGVYRHGFAEGYGAFLHQGPPPPPGN